jgi:hypothetical protein
LAKLCKELKDELKYLWEDELDEDIEIKMRDYITFSALQNPKSESMFSRKMKGQTLLTILSFIMDDVIDNLEEFGAEGLKYEDQTFTQLIDRITSGYYKTQDEIPSLAPAFASLMKFVFETRKYYVEFIPRFQERNFEYRKAVENALESLVLCLETKACAVGSDDGLSEGVLVHLNGYQSGFILSREFHFLILSPDEDLPAHVRQNVLFQLYCMSLGNACTLMNAVFGLVKDVNKNEVFDSPILRQVVHNGTPLQQAYNDTLQALLNSIRDVRVGGQKLRARYAEVQSLQIYTKSAEESLDGHLYAYLHVKKRYGNINLKIQKM